MDDCQRYALIERHRPLAESIARKYATSAVVDVDDLRAEAYLYLCEAAEVWTPSLRSSFGSYARGRIGTRLRRWVRNQEREAANTASLEAYDRNSVRIARGRSARWDKSTDPRTEPSPPKPGPVTTYFVEPWTPEAIEERRKAIAQEMHA